MEKIRWGILSTGNIARQFAHGLAALDDAELVAVGSRSAASANQFGDEFNVANRHASYEALASDPAVDAIYVATPHTLHAENTLLCLRAGKAVLCEKPFAINAAETTTMIAEARTRGVFLMEAMWTRFLPHMVRIRELIHAGAIGDVRMLNSTFGFRTEFDPKGRLFDPALGGGALLDVGIYPVSFAAMIFGTPTFITSHATIGATGVDEQVAMIFGYDQGQIALLASATRTQTIHTSQILGTKGQIIVEPPWWGPSSLTLKVDGQPDQYMAFDTIGNGYNYEAAEVARCLRAGKIESEVMPLDETLALMKTLDTIRGQWGLRYPGE